MILSSLWLGTQAWLLASLPPAGREHGELHQEEAASKFEAATRPTSEWDWPGLGDVRVGGHSRQHLLSCAPQAALWEAGCWLEAGHLECCVTSHFCSLRTSVFLEYYSPGFLGVSVHLVPPSAVFVPNSELGGKIRRVRYKQLGLVGVGEDAGTIIFEDGNIIPIHIRGPRPNATFPWKAFLEPSNM